MQGFYFIDWQHKWSQFFPVYIFITEIFLSLTTFKSKIIEIIFFRDKTSNIESLQKLTKSCNQLEYFWFYKNLKSWALTIFICKWVINLNFWSTSSNKVMFIYFVLCHKFFSITNPFSRTFIFFRINYKSIFVFY